MSVLIGTQEIQLDDTIRFRSIAPHDNVLYLGKVEGICGYDIVNRTFADIDVTYQDILRTGAALTIKEEAVYLLVRVTENETGAAVLKVFGTEWIEPSSLEIVIENSYTDLRVYDIDENIATELKDYIASCGYTVEIKK